MPSGVESAISSLKSSRGIADEIRMSKNYVNRMDPSRLIDESIKATYSKDDQGADRRRHRRIKGSGAMTSNLGTVLDISASGMRVLGKTEATGQGRVELMVAGESVVVPARIVWSHKVGFRKYVTGLEFIDLDDRQVQRVREMATAA